MPLLNLCTLGEVTALAIQGIAVEVTIAPSEFNRTWRILSKETAKPLLYRKTHVVRCPQTAQKNLFDLVSVEAITLADKPLLRLSGKKVPGAF